MAIILDADVIIRGEKGAFDLQGWLAQRPDDEFEIAAITVAELWHGVERATGEHRRKRQEYLETVLAPLPIIPYTAEIAREPDRVWGGVGSRWQDERLLRHHRRRHSKVSRK